MLRAARPAGGARHGDDHGQRRRAAACTPSSTRWSRTCAQRGMVSSLITNGYLPLARAHPARSTTRGLDYLQISIDNVEPDDVSMKSLRLLEPKLKWLAEHARVRRQHQLGGGGGHQEPRGRAGRRAARARAGLHQLDRHPARRPRPAAAARRARDGRLRGAQDARQPRRRARQRAVPGQPGPRPAQRLELPRGLALPLRGRGRPRQLLLAAARHARRPARELHARRRACASTTRARPARPTARSTASSGWRSSTTGARPQTRRGACRCGRAPAATRASPGARAADAMCPADLDGRARARHRRVERHRRGLRARAARARAAAGAGGAPRGPPARAGARSWAATRRPWSSPLDLAAPDAGRAPAGGAARGAGSRSTCWSTTRASATPAPFHEEPLDRVLAMIDLNVRAVVELTRRFLPGMVARRRGGIVNVVSTSAFQPVPVPGGLRGEQGLPALVHRGAGHRARRARACAVQALCPGLTATEFQQVAGHRQGCCSTGRGAMTPAAGGRQRRCARLERGTPPRRSRAWRTG